MRSADYAKRAEEVRTIAEWIEPSRYVEKNAHAASTEAKAELLRVATMYQDLADAMRRIEHVLDPANRWRLDTIDELAENEEFSEI